MAERDVRRMTVEEFPAWRPDDDQGYALAGEPCEPFTDGIAVGTPKGDIRRPDVTVDRGDPDPENQVAARPMLSIEVLSDPTRRFDEYLNLNEYRAIPGLRHVLLMEPDMPAVAFHARGDDGRWNDRPLFGYDTRIDLPALGCSLDIADLYPLRS